MVPTLDAIRPRIQSLEASLIGEVSRLGRGQADVLPLWFGEGDEPTPDFICEAAAAAMRAGETFYTYNLGIPPLREALAAYETRLHQKPVEPGRIALTSAGMQSIFLAAQCLVDPGDNVAVISPVWPNVRAAIQIFGGEARDVALGRTADGGFRLDIAALEAACDARTRAIFVNTPNNPTGWMASHEEAQAVLDLARRKGIWLIADEVYTRIVYDRPVAPSFLDLIEPDDRVLVANSFSKNWAMTGWRVGWLVMPHDWEAMLAKIVQYNTSGAPTFLQHGCLAAITEGEGFVSRMTARYKAGRDLTMEYLGKLPGITLRAPDAAFYAFLQVEGLTDSLDLAKRILTETRVGLAPGAAFGLGGEGHLRLCFAASRDRLEPALERLARFFGRN